MSSLAIGATLLTLVFTYIVYISWKKQSASLAWVGWLGLFGNTSIWITASGPEFGVIYAFFLPAIFVWLGIYSEQKKLSISSPIVKSQTKWQWQPKKVSQNVGHGLYLLIGLLLVSSLLTIAGVYLLPMSEPTKMAIGIITVPMIWGILAFWYLATTSKIKPLLFSLFSIIACGAFLFT